MRLFHYTGNEHRAGIERQGISQGGVPLPSGRQAFGIWLTDDPDWDQPWATQHTLHCDRTELRFIVTIPKAHRADLYHWPAIADRLLGHENAVEFARQGMDRDQHWYVYAHPVPRGWLRGVEIRPSGVLLANREH